MERVEQNKHDALKEVNINELTSKFRSKRELYNFLAQDCSAYLPWIDSTNVYFLRDII